MNVVKRKRITAVLVALATPLCLAYLAIQIVWPTYSWTQKMVLTASVNGKPVVGSSVTRISFEYHIPILPEGKRVTWSAKGEAVDLALPDGRHLFALLYKSGDGDYVANVAPRLFTNLQPARVHIGRRDSIFQRLSSFTGSRELPGSLYPLLVTFRDPSDPRSGEAVDPDALEKTFGPGFKLVGISLSINDGEPITFAHIADVLPWLDWPKEKLGTDGQGRNPVRIPGPNGSGSTALIKWNFRIDR